MELLGHSGRLDFRQGVDALRVKFPAERPCDYAFALKIDLPEVESPYGLRITFLVSEASDDPPTKTVKVPGSKAHRFSAFQTAS